MQIAENYPLTCHNTFAIESTAHWWISYDSVEDLQRLARDEYFVGLPLLRLGHGSNLLLTTDYFDGAVLSSAIKNIRYYSAEDSVLTHEGQQHISVGSGVVWDDLVARTLADGLYGLENLSLIPGTVGAAAVQNIGAYGTEVSQYIVSVEAVDLASGQCYHLPSTLCNYRYRHSIFKESAYHSWVITRVDFVLSTIPTCNLSYASLAQAFANMDTPPSPQEIRTEVIRIRESKLPDPRRLPNAGSFFMNPLVSVSTYERIVAESGVHVPHYTTDEEGYVKLSAAWMIDQVGLKGYRMGPVGVYDLQPLVLVNYGGAMGEEIVALAEEVQRRVEEHFGVRLQPEVLYI